MENSSSPLNPSARKPQSLPPPPVPSAALHLPPGYGPPPGVSGYEMPPQGYDYPPQQGMPMPFSIPGAVASMDTTPESASGDSAAMIHAEGEVYHPPMLSDIGPAPRRNKFVEAWRKIGGGSLALSIGIHVGLFFFAGLVIFTTTQIEKNVDFLPGGGTVQGQQASAEVREKKEQKNHSALNKSMTTQRVAVVHPTHPQVSLPEASSEIIEVPDVSSKMGGSMGVNGGFGPSGAGGGFNKGIGVGLADGIVALPASMSSRCSPAERLQKLAQNGGSPDCEAAVSRSLAWLKSNQNKEGYWGKQHKAAMTGLSLLCYLGRCETPDSLFYGDNVMQGILYLIELSKKNQWNIIAEDPKEHSSCYEHGIGTYALGEMYTLSRLGSKPLPGMKEAFEKGVERIIAMQLPDGGWGYGEGGDFCYRSTGKGDLSVTGWQYQALKAAKHTGLKIKGLHESINKAVDYLESSQTKDGGFGVTNRDAGYNQWNLSGCGILGLLTLGNNKTTQINKGIKFLNDFIKEEPLDWNKNANLYCWYYFTQAYFQKGGEDWKFYNQQFLPQMLNNQNPDGQWKDERSNSAVGSTSPAGGDRVVYRQALCTLMLEVYYRYLKVADRSNESFFDRVK